MTYIPGGGGGGGSVGTSSDVALNNPVDGQALTYDGSTQKWINSTVGEGNYALPSPWPVDARASLSKQDVARPNAAIVNWLVDTSQAAPTNFNNGSISPTVYPGDWLSEQVTV